MKLQGVTATVSKDGTGYVLRTGGVRQVLADLADPLRPRHGPPTVVDRISHRFGAVSGRDHDEPGEAAMTLLSSSADPGAVSFGARVEVRARTANTNVQMLVLAGTVQKVTTTAVTVSDPDTGNRVQLWRHDVDLVDQVGHWAGKRIGDTPWPQQTAQPRVQRLEQLAPGSLTTQTQDAVGRVRARDVDAQPVLDLYQATVVGGGLFVRAAGTGLTFARTIIQERTSWKFDADPAVPLRAPFPISAGAVEQTPREHSRAGHVGLVEVQEWHSVTAEEQWTRYYSPADVPTSTHTVESDAELISAGQRSLFASWVSTGSSPYALPTNMVRLFLDDVPNGDELVRQLLDLAYAHNVGRLAILRLLDGPEDLYTYQRAIQTQFILYADPDRADVISVQLEPLPLSGGRVTVLRELSDPFRWQGPDGGIWLQGDSLESYDEVTFRDFEMPYYWYSTDV